MQILDSGDDSMHTLVGDGTAGFADGNGTRAQLSEPSGLSLGPDGTVYVADTNNSVVR